MGPGVGNAPEGRSATCAYLGLIGELPRVNSCASLLALTAPIGMRALIVLLSEWVRQSVGACFW